MVLAVFQSDKCRCINGGIGKDMVTCAVFLRCIECSVYPFGMAQPHSTCLGEFEVADAIARAVQDAF